MCCGCCSVRQQKIWVFTIGCLLTAVGVALIIGGPSWSDGIIASNLPLEPGSRFYKNWVTTPLPVYMNIFLYNWTNPEEYDNPNVKPNFVELGPYSFRDYKEKKNIQWNTANSTVSFFNNHLWYFEQERSQGTLEDLITIPHFPSVVASKNSRQLHPIMRKIANFAVNREGGKLSMIQNAGDIIFNGYYDHLIDFAVRLHSPFVPMDSNKFAWFLDRNDSTPAEGKFTIHTGQGDLDQMGNLQSWNDNEFSGHYKGECGRVNGSTGEIWARQRHWHNHVTLYNFDAGRFLNFFPKNNVTYRGVTAWRYETTDRTLDNGNIQSDTSCFCIKGRECPKNGVVDFSSMAFGSPTYLSHRHFYMADPLYRENITVYNPDPKKHGMHVILEPKWGIPLEINGQVLISLLMEQDEKVDIFKNLSHNFYAPLLDLQFEYKINDEILKLTKFLLNLPSISLYIGIALTSIGVIMICIGLYVTKTHKWRGDSYPTKIENKS